MRQRISIVICAKNEALNLPAVLEAVKPHADEVIVVDGHSVDATAEVAARGGARVVLDHRLGKGDAIRVGANAAHGDILLFMDADHSHSPHDVPRLLEPLLNGDADHVSGSRMLGGSDELFSSIAEFCRLVGSEIITLTIGKRFGVRLTDSQNGFRCIRKDVFSQLRLVENSTTIEQEMVIETLRRGFRLIEVPTHEYRRAHGLSSIVVWKVGYRYVLCLIKNVLKPRLQNPAGDVHAAQERYRVRWDRQRPGERSDHEPAGVRQAVPVSPPTTPR